MHCEMIATVTVVNLTNTSQVTIFVSSFVVVLRTLETYVLNSCHVYHDTV